MDRSIIEMEQRFMELTGIRTQMEHYPLQANEGMQTQKTADEKRKKNGFVATPLFLCDYMIGMKEIDGEGTTGDCCAGFGQFTIRILRRLINEGKISNASKYLEEKHTLMELDPDNVAAEIYIFGPNINVYFGDVLKLMHAKQDETGVLMYNEKAEKWEHNKLFDELISNEKIYNNYETLKAICNNVNNVRELKKIKNKYIS